ncbi:MAG: hypothetical protein LBF36_03125, partial [Mycoplasmataceae bacterium]|nr:hypothetical protein [Mycoplasmataceae bacterium]
DSLSLSGITSDQLKDYFLLRHNLTDKNILNIIVYDFCHKILDGNKTPLKIKTSVKDHLISYMLTDDFISMGEGRFGDETYIYKKGTRIEAKFSNNGFYMYEKATTITNDNMSIYEYNSELTREISFSDLTMSINGTTETANYLLTFTSNNVSVEQISLLKIWYPNIA